MVTAENELTRLYYAGSIATAASSVEGRAEAEASKVELAERMWPELVVEGHINSLGFEDVIVTSTTENINVIVKCTELTGTQASQILQLVMTETETQATNVRIIATE